MPLILRFKNIWVDDTIQTHQEILDSQSHVWWGWFKKAHEDLPLTELQQHRERTPLIIGLVNRDEQTFHQAVCTEIALGDSESDFIPTPDPRRTPAYYEEVLLPAWFQIQKFEPVTPRSFEEMFGPVPEGDPTIAVNKRHSAKGRPRPKSTSPDSSPVLGAEGESVLHVSDVHFGEYHGFNKESFGDRSLLEILTEFLDESKVSVGVAVASGDFTSRGDTTPLIANAAHFVEGLAEACGLPLTHVAAVPGNHDIWLEEKRNLDLQYRFEDPYRRWIKSVWGTDSREIDGLTRIRTSGGWTLNLVVMNSARPRSMEDRHFGYVGKDRYSPLIKRLKKLNQGMDPYQLIAKKQLNVAVLHHHVLPVAPVARPREGVPVSVTLDAGGLISDFQEAGLHVVLHGHEHLPFIGTVNRMGSVGEGTQSHLGSHLIVLGSGSTGADRGQLHDECLSNTFSIYTPTGAGLRVQVFKFRQSLSPTEIVDIDIPFTSARIPNRASASSS